MRTSHYLKESVLTWQAGVLTWQAGVLTCQAGVLTCQAGVTSSMAGALTLGKIMDMFSEVMSSHWSVKTG